MTKKPDAGQPELKPLPNEIWAAQVEQYHGVDNTWYEEKTSAHPTEAENLTRYVRADLPTATPTEANKALDEMVGLFFMSSSPEYSYDPQAEAERLAKIIRGGLQSDERQGGDAPDIGSVRAFLERLKNLPQSVGLEGATSGDTTHDSVAVAYGYNAAIELVQNRAEEFLCLIDKGYLTTQKSPDKPTDPERAKALGWFEDLLLQFFPKHTNPPVVQTIRAALSDVAPVDVRVRDALDGWQPIETAPKDGTRVILGKANKEDEPVLVCEGRWIEGYADGPDYMGHDDGWSDVCGHGFFTPHRSFGAGQYRHLGRQPTHWMPLPKEPTASKGEG